MDPSRGALRGQRMRVRRTARRNFRGGGRAGAAVAVLVATIAVLPVSNAFAQTPSLLTVTSEVIQTGTHYADWVPGNLTTPSGNGVNAPYTGTFDPGDDFWGKDDWVRTLDVTTVKVTYSVSPEVSSGPTQVVVKIDGGPAFLTPDFALAVGTGGQCPGVVPSPGNPLDYQPNPTRTGFTCKTGSVDKSAGTRNFEVQIVAPMSTPHGNAFTVTATLSEDGLSTPNVVSATSAPTKVSAGPRFDLVKRALPYPNATSNGPTGTSGPGVTQRWAIGLASLSAEPYGLSALPNPVVLKDLALSTAPAGVWLQGCTNAAGGGYGPWPPQVTGTPGPTQLKAPDPTPCTQSAGPNGPITVSLAGLDWSRLTTLPAPGLVGYFELDTWVSKPDILSGPGNKLDICNAVETTNVGQRTSAGGWVPGTAAGTWQPVDVSGNSNLLGQLEPIANNGACQTTQLPQPPPDVIAAGFYKTRVTPDVDGAALTKTDIARSALVYQNSGNQPYPAGGVLCDKFDDSRFTLNGFALASSGTFTPQVKVEYGTGAWGSNGGASTDPQKWWKQATSDCSDANFGSPQVVQTSGPLSALTGSGFPLPSAGQNMIRITILDFMPVGSFVRIDPTWKMQPGAMTGDELRNYSAFFTPTLPTATPTPAKWLTSNCPSSVANECAKGLIRGQSAGNWSQWWTIGAGSVAVVKSRPDSAAYGPGGTMTWNVTARGVPTVAGATGSTAGVKIVDTLPPGFKYVPGTTTGLAEPDACTTTDPQVCTWTLGTLAWSATPTVSFSFQTTVSVFEPSGTYTNTARGTTPDDPTPNGSPSFDKRVSTANVLILRATAAAIDKSVLPASPVPGGNVDFTLRYGNPSSQLVASMDAIDILPFGGDPRGSVFAPGSFTLTGITPSTKTPVAEEIWVTNAAPAGLDALDGADGYLDPAASGVTPPGSAQWPCKLAAGGALVDATTGGSCSFLLDKVTAVRFVGGGTVAQPFLPAGTGPYAIGLKYKLATCVTGNKFANSWLADFSGLLPVRYRADTAAASGCPPVEPPQGTLKVCKVAGPGVAVGTVFTFHIGSTTLTIPAGPPPGGTCKVVPGSFPVGAVVNVDEPIPPGDKVNVKVAPAGQVVGTFDPASGSVSVKIGNGVTEVTFTNSRTGFIEICKEASGEGVTGDATFYLDPGNLGPFVVPVGSCSPLIEVTAGSVTISEPLSATTRLDACSTIPTERQVACDKAAQASTVTVVPGDTSTQTIAYLTNIRKDSHGTPGLDVAVFRPSNGTWYIHHSTSPDTTVAFGTNGDIPVAADYDGDGKVDIAVFRPSTGTWYIRLSSGGVTTVAFGTDGDIPVPADYDGDGKADIAVYRPATGTWYIRPSSGGAAVVVFGTFGDIPVPGDYDGDGRADVAVFRPSTGIWYIHRSSGGDIGVSFGTAGDVPVAADYDGDGKIDVAVYRPSASQWYIHRSSGGDASDAFGAGNDIPAPADYDSDGKADVAVFRPSTGQWLVRLSSGGDVSVTFGTDGDVPVRPRQGFYG